MQTAPLFPTGERPFRFPSSRTAPGIFVSHFYVLRSLEKPSTQIQRRVLLRKGLNILWADPNPGQPPTTKRKSKVAGHTAGKSTFCRLLRYALGEVSFGNENQEGKICLKFPDGWVVLRVEVDGVPWIVGRSFADKHTRFAARGMALDDFLRDGVTSHSGYAEFAQTLEDGC